jgi:hypothetical protein
MQATAMEIPSAGQGTRGQSLNIQQQQKENSTTSERRPMSRIAFGEWFAPMTAGAKRLPVADSVIGEHRTDVQVGGGVTGLHAELVRRKGRAWGYALGTLETARLAFIKVTGLTTITWPDEDAEGPLV